MSDETVRLDISIQIDTQDVVDTGITVVAWNAMTAPERGAIAQEIWNDMAQHDNGGISVVTAGAEEV